MANKKLIEVSLQKSYKGELNSGLNSALFQYICETALEIISENERLKERLQISPQGDDKIDELEATIQHYKFQIESLKLKETVVVQNGNNNTHIDHVDTLNI